MSAEPPPYDGSAGYNPDNWLPDAGTGAVDEEYLATNYLQFPIAQGSETLGDAIISGTLTAQDATFADVVNLNSDTIATGNFTINSNIGATNDVLIYPQSTFNGAVVMGGTLSSNAQATFAGSASTTNANAPIKLTNGVAGEYATFYLNPSSGEDITLYTNQNPNGGLTIRGANGASFTMNPATVQDGVGCLLINPLSMNGNTLSGLNNVYANTGSTITIQSPISLGANATSTTPTALQTTNVANVAYVSNAIANINFSTYAPLASPAFTGTPTYGGYTLATVNQIPSLTPYAPLASPAFTGTPTISTTPTSSQTTAIANVQYVADAISGITPISLANYAQLTLSSGGFQTFTTPISFSSSTSPQIGSNTIATINQLPIYYANIPISLVANINSQIAINGTWFPQTTITQSYSNGYGSTKISSFLNVPIIINTNLYTQNVNITYNNPVLFPMMAISLGSVFPFGGTSYPVYTTTYNCLGTTGNGLSITFTISFGQVNGVNRINFGYPYNLGNNSSCTISLSSIGDIILYN
jgi:hypothetical protein